ncbi:MAG: TIGR00159 family protein [Gemmatimonadetes bacterium]|nr:TIGR00159 family protein [Gemmatimonadota bacterium]
MLSYLLRMSFLRPSLLDLVDIAAVAFLVYQIFMLIRGTRAVQMLMGFLILMLGASLAQLLSLSALNRMLTALQAVWLVAIVLVFQPELRTALARLGRNRYLRFFVKPERSPVLEEIVVAARELSKARVGALLALQRENSLEEYVDTGTRIGARATADLLRTIFTPYSPLHDGAAILEGQRVVAASCILPLPREFPAHSDLGTRHRAAVGLTEETDAVVVVVSEETGTISLAVGGELETGFTSDTLRERLQGLMSAPAASPASAPEPEPVLERVPRG